MGRAQVAHHAGPAQQRQRRAALRMAADPAAGGAHVARHDQRQQAGQDEAPEDARAGRRAEIGLAVPGHEPAGQPDRQHQRQGPAAHHGLVHEQFERGRVVEVRGHAARRLDDHVGHLDDHRGAHRKPDALVHPSGAQAVGHAILHQCHGGEEHHEGHRELQRLEPDRRAVHQAAVAQRPEQRKGGKSGRERRQVAHQP